MLCSQAFSFGYHLYRLFHKCFPRAMSLLIFHVFYVYGQAHGFGGKHTVRSGEEPQSLCRDTSGECHWHTSQPTDLNIFCRINLSKVFPYQSHLSDHLSAEVQVKKIDLYFQTKMSGLKVYTNIISWVPVIPQLVFVMQWVEHILITKTGN